MSVILTACRQSKQKAIARALKKKAEKKRAKREAAAQQLETEQDDMDDIEGENNVKIWTFLLNGQPTSVVLHRDSLEVACNGDIVDSTSDFCASGSTINFPIGGQDAQITCCFGETPQDEITFTLAIEGCPVPDPTVDQSTMPLGARSGTSADVV